MELNMKHLLIAAALASMALSGTAQAQMMAACNDETMMKAEKDLMAMTDPAKKDMMEMAMKDNKEKDCSMHLDAAMKAAMGQ
jgi:cbb3-type cytochrome oxidase cytochrome c subunit